MNRSTLTLAVLLLIACLAATYAQAAVVQAYTPIDGGLTGAHNPDGDPGQYTMGFRFSVSQPIYITDLGYNANSQFEGAHAVGIFPDTNGSPLVSANVVVPTNGNTGATFYEFTTLGVPYLLLAGTYRIAGSTYDINNVTTAHGYPWSNPLSAAVAPQVTWIEGVFANGGPLNWPSTQTSNSFYTANFRFTEVPEPASLTIVALGGMLCLRRRHA